MGNKTKTRLMIMILGWYLIGTIWLGAFIYNNYLAGGYEIAYWLTITFHYLSLYVIVAHYSIEGKD
jgi:hypothetical protein